MASPWASYTPQSLQGTCLNTSFNAESNNVSFAGTLCVGGRIIANAGDCSVDYNGDWSPGVPCQHMPEQYPYVCTTVSTKVLPPASRGNITNKVFSSVIVDDPGNLVCKSTLREAGLLCSASQDTGSNAFYNCPCTTGSHGYCPGQDIINTQQVCRNDACSIVGPTLGNCLTDKDCTDVAASCVLNGTPTDPIEEGTCSGAKTCVPRTQPNAEPSLFCPPGSYCDESEGAQPICKPGCTTKENCTGNPNGWTECVNLHCVPPGCTKDTDCSNGLKCEFGSCAQLCSSSSSCPTGQVCSQSAPFRCGDACTSPSDCLASEVCDGDACVAGCTGPGQCADDHSCIHGQCTAQCLKDSDCTKNQYCGPNGHCFPYQRTSQRGRTKITDNKWLWIGLGIGLFVIIVFAVVLIRHKHIQAGVTSDASADSTLQL